MSKLTDYLQELNMLPNQSGGSLKHRLNAGVSDQGIAWIKLASTNNTAYYIFATNDGRLQVNTAEPTANTDGTTVTITQIDTTALVPVGTRFRDKNSNEFIYMQGVASLDATHNWVTFDDAYVTSLLAAGAKGQVAIAMSVLSSSTATFGWYQVLGKCAVAGTDTIATGAVLYIDASSGRVDDSAVTGDLVLGAVSRSTDSSTNIATVTLNYPQVTTKIG